MFSSAFPTLPPHGLQHTRVPCPSPTAGASQGFGSQFLAHPVSTTSELSEWQKGLCYATEVSSAPPHKTASGREVVMRKINHGEGRRKTWVQSHVQWFTQSCQCHKNPIKILDAKAQWCLLGVKVICPELTGRGQGCCVWNPSKPRPKYILYNKSATIKYCTSLSSVGHSNELLKPIYVLCLKSLSRVRLFATPRTVACQVPLSMGILQARILEWVAMLSSRGSSQPRDQTQVSRIGGRFFIIWATREALLKPVVTSKSVDSQWELQMSWGLGTFAASILRRRSLVEDWAPKQVESDTESKQLMSKLNYTILVWGRDN